MDVTKRQICFGTLFMLLSATATIAIGYTQLVQAEIKEDTERIEQKADVNTEKITNIQVSNARIEGKLDIIIENLDHEKVKKPSE